MKKNKLLLLGLLTSFATFGQTDKPTNTRTVTAPSHPTQEIKTYTAQQEFDLAKQIPKDITPTPTASASTFSLADRNNPSLSAEGTAAVRFKNVPVNLATGAMSLPIPIYTLSEGLLSVPISLDYNGSGMKNQEVASFCGANWSLNAGGMITRMVRGLPDEGVKNGSTNLRGYFKFGFSGNGSSVDNDTEPDIFYLNINGATYKMMYRHDGENAKFEFFPDSDIKVIPTFQFLSGNSTVGKFVKFEVIMSDGTQYTFGNGATESTAEAEAGFIQSAGNYPGTSGFNTFWANNAQTSVWYLTKIKSVYGQTIDFDYDRVQYSYYRIGDHGVDNSQTPASVCPSPSDVIKTINRVFVNSVSLAKIRGINTKIEINQRDKICTTQYDPSSGDYVEFCEFQDLSNPRIDIESWSRYPQNQSNSKRLNEIMVMENTEFPKDTLFYKFSYGHFSGVSNDLPAGYSESNSSLIRVGFTHQRRLRLEKIDFPDQTNVRFRHKGDSPNYNGKSRLDFGIDHWGFANGFTGNKSLTGLIPRDSEYPNCTAATSNRDSDPAFGFYGSLDSVIFSNRKTIAFEYEMHTAKNYKDALGNLKPIGGPRIKTVTNKDLISGIETKKVYDYTLNGQTTGHLAIKPTYRYKTPFQEIGSHSSIYDRILGEMGRPPVVYSRVTERLLNTSNQGLGKTVYYFDNDTTALSTYEKYAVNCTGTYPNQVCDTVEYVRPEKVHPASVIGNWDHKYQTGNLVRTEVFNENNDTLSVQELRYITYPLWNGRQTAAAKVFRVNNRNLGYTTCCGGLFTQSYPIFFTKYRLKSQTSKTFSQFGTNPIVTQVDYVYKDEMPNDYQQKYKGKHNQLVKTETTDSKGNFSEQFIKYPADFEFGLDTIHYEQTCYDEFGSYDCSYDEYIQHVPQAGSQARGIFEFKFANIFEFPLETNAKLNTFNLGASYNVISAFTKPAGGFNFAPNKTFSSGNIGSFFTDMEYFRTPNDTITREPSYFLNNTILSFTDYGLPTVSKPFGAVQSQQNFDASKLLITNQIHNIAGVVTDSTVIFYAKKLFGANRTIGINKMESIVVFDSTFKKGSVKQKLDKDRNLLAQIDFFEPLENFTMAGISLDNTKYRTISRSPRIATQTLPAFGDNLDVDVAYSDADGRNLQNKSLRASPTRKDIIGSTPVFDSFGRTQKSILPVNATNANGSFETNILAKAQTAYSDMQPLSEVTQYEASPLSRTFKTIGAGAAFRPSKEGVQTFETGNFGIAKATVSNANILNIGTYANNQITKSSSTDPNGNKSISYADKEGRTLETWVQVSGDGSSPTHFLKTTYLYDYLNRPIAVIPPKLYGQITDGTNLLTSPYFNLLHYSIYDSRGRVVEKHTPDAGWSYIIYNRMGQVVLSQNARHRETNLWAWSKFGARGQSVMSGILTQSTYTRTQLQTLFDNFTEEKQFEERTTSSTNEYYTVRSFPPVIQVFINPADIKTVAYFDDYGWLSGVETTNLAFSKYKTERWPNAKGLMTGNKVRRLDTNTWLTSTMYYDDQNRLIQTKSVNRFGQINQTDIVLDFIGQLLENRAIYRKTGSADFTIATKYTYDHTGRKQSATHSLNGKTELLASYEYDELGRLVQKNLNEASQNSITRSAPILRPQVSDIAKKFVLLQPGTCITGDSVYSAFIAAGLQKVNYSYDIRGNIVGINLKPNGDLDSSKVFALKLDYHQDGRYYNGLLSRQSWLADNITRSYTFSYDKANRYNKAIFSGFAAENYNENAAYDANGNILNLNRFGKTSPTTFSRIDSLSYTYSSNSNKLVGISDLANNTIGHKDNGNANDYTFYADGSQKSDANKGITNIIYNYLGLQDEIIFSPTQKIKNVYSSDGQKLIQYLINGSTTIKTDYVGELIYVNDTLQTIFHDEGRVRFDNSGQPHYQYFIEDHLGNNRVVFEKLNDSVFVAQLTDYYPFGSPHSTENLQFKFLYQGKEYVDFLGLNSYDFHARGLDTWTGRFSGVDPVDNYALSGYASMMNNPISYVDPDGREPIAIGFMIGIFTNAIIKMAQGKEIKNMWQFVSPGIVGAIGGGLGALAPIGVLPGMAYGAGSGAVTGGISAAFNGGNIGRGALMGGIGGGIFGGINGYFSTPDGVNPWTGTGSASHAFNMSANPSGSNWASTDEMRASYDGTIGLKDNMQLSTIEDKLNTNVSLASNNNLPSSDYFMDNGSIAFATNNGGIGYAGGVTSAKYKFGFIKNSYIRMSPSLKSTSIEFQNFVFKHEFMHAWHWKINSSLYSEFSERATSTYTLAYQKAYNITSQLHTTRLALAGAGGSNYPSIYSWRNFNKIVPLWIK